MDRVRQGFDILERYDNTGGDVSSEHDQIFAGPEGVTVSDEDAARLRELFWEFDEDIERWYCL